MNNSVIQKLSILCLLIVCSVVAFFLGSTCALGDDTAGGDTTSSDSPPTTPAPITGGVVKIDVAMSDLRDARLATHRVRKAAANLYDEMTRHEMMMGYNPNVVGSILIMAPAPMAGPILPARKQWVDQSMGEIEPVIKLFKQDVEVAIDSHRRTDVSDKAKEELDPLKQKAFATVEKSFDTFKQLETLTQASQFGTYDQPSIAAAAKSLDQEMKELDKELKKGISILQKEAKAEKKST